MPRIRGSVVALTGASSGIGAASAEIFAKKGAHLVLGARRLDRLQAVAERCRRAGAASVSIRRTDVSRREECRAFVAGALRDHDRLDTLVNNAGLGWMGRFQEMPEAEARTLVETNLMGTIWTTQAALPSMLGRRRGVIVNVASVVGFRAVPYSTLYSATKHAMVGLSHGLRGELTGTGVKVSVVYPGPTRSEFFNATEHSVLPLWSTEWVARAVVRSARWPRRDAIVLPFRIVQLLEPLLGGFLDHALGEGRRQTSSSLQAPRARRED